MRGILKYKKEVKASKHRATEEHSFNTPWAFKTVLVCSVEVGRA